MASLPVRLIARVVLSSGIGYLVSAAAVIDLNFVDLPEIVKAAELIEDQSLPIRLARMDISSRGGMVAWQEFELKRVPAVKIFVGNNIDEPLPYSGHLDAGGIAAHLAMLERDRRRLLEHQEKYGGSHASNSRRTSGGVGDADEMRVVEEFGLTLVALSVPTTTSSATISTSSAETAAVVSLTDKFREAVGRQELSLAFFVADDSPRTRRMIAELRKAAPRLAGSDPPIGAVLVDLRSPESSSSSSSPGSSGRRDGSRKSSGRGPDPTGGLDSASSAKRRLATDIGVSVGDVGQELRIFLDGKPWVEGGTFRGMPTADGILKHMEWVAMEAGLPPQNVLGTAGQEGRSCSCESTATAGVAVADGSSAGACTVASGAGGCSHGR